MLRKRNVKVILQNRRGKHDAVMRLGPMDLCSHQIVHVSVMFVISLQVELY